MEQFENQDVRRWLATALDLRRDAFSASTFKALEDLAARPQEFATFVDAQGPLVDHALTAMALAESWPQAMSLTRQLAPETLMCLAHRWIHYLKAWQGLLNQRDPHLWVPPRDVWRAVLLAMTGEGTHSSAAARALWPEHF